MPNMNGLDLVKAIRENINYGKLPILMITTEGGKTEVIRNPSDSTFYFVLYAADGGTICGHLQAYQ